MPPEARNFDATEGKRKLPRQIKLVVLKNRNSVTWEKVELEYYPLFNYFRDG